MSERVIGILSRELLDRVLILNERHLARVLHELARVLHEYLIYYNWRQRTNPGSNGPLTSQPSPPVTWPTSTTCNPSAENQ